MKYVLIHVHEGTIINSWMFVTMEDRAAFRARFGESDLPGTRIFDDPDTDTWIWVETSDEHIVIDDGRPEIWPA